MSIVRVNSFAVSLDGYAAGLNQSIENPLGVRGPELFEWFFCTRTWKKGQLAQRRTSERLARLPKWRSADRQTGSCHSRAFARVRAAAL